MFHSLLEIILINRSNKTRSLLRDKHDRCHSDPHCRVSGTLQQTSIIRAIINTLVNYLAELFYKLKIYYGSSYLLWKRSGKLRGDVTECDMRTSRLKFKYAFRQCRNNEEMMRADALARSLYCKDSVAFWKDVRKLNSSSIPLATKVDDAVGNKNITHLWQEHFSTLLNSVHNTDSKEFVSEHIEHGLSSVQKTTVSASDVLDS